MTTPTPETGTDDLRAKRARRGKANRDRGAVAERNLAKYLRANGFPGAERAVRAGWVGQNRSIADPGDLTGTPAIVWQVKDVVDERIGQWLAETERQRKAANADYGVLVVRRRGARDAGGWWCWLPLAGLFDLAAELHHLGGHEIGERPVRLELETVVRFLRYRGYGDPVVTE